MTFSHLSCYTVTVSFEEGVCIAKKSLAIVLAAKVKYVSVDKPESLQVVRGSQHGCVSSIGMQASSRNPI